MSLHTVTVLTMGGFTQGCLSLIERICIRVGAGLLDLLVDLLVVPSAPDAEKSLE